MNTIFDALRADHDLQRELLDEVSATSGDSPERQAAFGRLSEELRQHATAEERVFYSQILGDSMTQPKSSHGIHEHQQIDALVQELDEMEHSNPNWIRRLAELKEKVEHHLEEEEHGVFQLAGKVLSESEKEALGKDFRALREELATAS